jgi:hypothetical protein
MIPPWLNVLDQRSDGSALEANEVVKLLLTTRSRTKKMQGDGATPVLMPVC